LLLRPGFCLVDAPVQCGGGEDKVVKEESVYNFTALKL